MLRNPRMCFRKPKSTSFAFRMSDFGPEGSRTSARRSTFFPARRPWKSASISAICPASRSQYASGSRQLSAARGTGRTSRQCRRHRLAFGSSDSHDEHYFASPDHMIRGAGRRPSAYPDNLEIMRRHLRPIFFSDTTSNGSPSCVVTAEPLFAVLGTVRDFKGHCP